MRTYLPLCASLLLLTACNIWPSARMNTSGLGPRTPLTELLSQQWMNSNAALQTMIAGAAGRYANGSPMSKETAEGFGFTCPQDLLSCRYQGSLTVRYTGMPAENAERSAERVAVEVRLVQVQPVAVSVHITRTSFNGG
jgi:hypothetical protein